MFPPSSTAYLQTGFRTPEIYTVLMVWGLRLGANASEFNVVAFYYATSVVGINSIKIYKVVGTVVLFLFFF
jgi:hypothetical protein